MPTNQVFKFLSVRPPESVKPGGITLELPPISLDRPTRLGRAVAELEGVPQARAKAGGLAREFLASDSYVPTSRAAEPFLQRMAAVESALRRLPMIAESDKVAEAIEREIGESPARIVASDDVKSFEEDLWNSVYANVLAPEERPHDRDVLFRSLRTIHLLRLVAQPEGARRLLPIDRLRSETPLLPPDLFPTSRPEEPGESGKDGRPNPAEALLKVREHLHSARDEVERHYRRNRTALLAGREEAESTAAPLPAPGRGDLSSAAPPSRDDEGSPGRPATARLRTAKPPSAQPRAPWRLVRRDLSRETLEVLEEAGLSPEVDDVPQVLDRLDRVIGQVNARLVPLAGRLGVRRIGSSQVYERQPISQAFNILQPPRGGTLLPTGPSTLPQPLPPAARAPERPFRVLGIGDLLVVRETLLRYEAGELAHVENVLSGENKTRVHRRKRQTEEVVAIETERVEEQERDLQSTERFETQKESQRTIETDVSVQAGLSVSANYGYVSVATTANFAYDSAKSESERSASTYARNVTERAVSRIQERVRAQRTRRSLEEFEETNTHTLDAKGQGHVRGVYQWIDKVYSMQLVNYGQRLMLEFIVPEPAAFYIFAQHKTMMEGAGKDKPVSPEELGLTSHEVLNAQTFPIYVAAYQVEAVKPPPPELTVIAKAFNQEPVETPTIFTKASDDLTITAGYRASLAFVTYSAFGNVVESRDRRGDVILVPDPNEGGSLQLGNYAISLASNILPFFNEDQKIPLSIITNEPAYILNVEVECAVRPEHRLAWQLETYGAIVSAYKVLKSQYDEEAARARVRQGIEISGRNPQQNRQIEREELKKGCLTLLTGSQFQDFSGIAANTSVEYVDYPEIAVDAVHTHATTIQFIEQAFEWDQMTYLFYPYFWGRKQNWLNIFPLEDIDHKFADFLRAGAARVIVPATPAYADAVLHYIATGEPWNGGPAPTIDDPLFRSISAELRRKQGDYFEPRDGGLSVSDGSRAITGRGTLFTDDDANREIRIRGAVYRIQQVVSPTEILLTEPYAGADEEDVPFSIGALLVDQPWTVRVPTSLVFLREDGQLPDFTAAP